MATGQLSPVLSYLGRVAAGRLSDGELLGRYLEGGDRAALGGLVERHGAMVLGVCRRVLGNGHDAEDAVQAVFLLLLRQWSRSGCRCVPWVRALPTCSTCRR